MTGSIGKVCAVFLILLIAGTLSIPKTRADEPVIRVPTRAVVVGPSNVVIDIKPGSYPNCINLWCNGRIPVAVLTTPNFNASTVDRHTVVFAGASPVHWAMKDVDRDGDLDLVLHFKCRDVRIPRDATQACLQASTYDGMSIIGCDFVHIVPRSWPRLPLDTGSSVLAGTHLPAAATSLPPTSSGRGTWHGSLPWAGATFGGGVTLIGVALVLLPRPRR